MKKLIILILSFGFIIPLSAQKQKNAIAPESWFNLDLGQTKTPGVSTEKAYAEVLAGKKMDTIVVAVIDGGTDIFHEDLSEVLWTNKGEIPGNGIDDDKNGYIDDVHGWNFIGGKDSSINYETLELTRQYRKYKKMFEGKDTTKLTAAQEADRLKYRSLETQFYKGRAEYADLYNEYNLLLKEMDALREKANNPNPSTEIIEAWKPENKLHVQIRKILIMASKKNPKAFSSVYKSVERGVASLEKFPKYHYGLDFDPRYVVGDEPDDLINRFYGCAEVKGPEASHGTHVAGIIAASRLNSVGIMGISSTVKIMVLRVVPDGDERDKDVANAIRYAAENGAKIINMSFGKSISPDKKYVDEAVRFAASKDVLLVHAAGNDHKNLDVESNFPNPRFEGTTDTCSAWLEIGASGFNYDKTLPAPFSNYGERSVDVFAPGVDIMSTTPENQYAAFSGTSMACPVTAGVAALIRSCYPSLTAPQVRQIIMKSAVPVKHKVLVPGSKKKKVKFSKLCKTGAVVNAYQALKLAESMKP